MKLVLAILLMFSGYTFAQVAPASATLTNEPTATPSKVAPTAKTSAIAICALSATQ